jgi:hypothetical protein
MCANQHQKVEIAIRPGLAARAAAKYEDRLRAAFGRDAFGGGRDHRRRQRGSSSNRLVRRH